MEKKESTTVVCQACKSNRGVKKTQRFVFIVGGTMLTLAIYGGIKLIKDIISLF